jgi:hypothetical protein
MILIKNEELNLSKHSPLANYPEHKYANQTK